MVRLLLAFALLASLARADEPTFKIKLQESRFSKGYRPAINIRGVKRVDFWKNQKHLILPNRIDLRAIGKGLSQIEDQGRAGNCWAFAQISALRDTWIRLDRDPGRLSTQYLVDSARAIGMGCDGGDFDAYRYLQRPLGAPKWEEYPYSDRRCSGPLKKSNPVASLKNFIEIVPSHYNMMYVLSVLKRPLIVVVAAGSGMWEYYDGGIYNACRSGNVDHMINMVGIDRQGKNFMTNGNLPNGIGVGILRNQWTTNWGEAGWMNTLLTDKRGNACNEIGVQAGYFEVENISDK